MPPHNHTASDESSPDSLSNSSFSLVSSQISIQSSQFNQEVEGVIESTVELTDLVDQAMKLAVLLASREEYNRPLHAPPKGGKRYTASAIYSCRRQDNKDTLGCLQSLATTWLSHLLFVFKVNGSNKHSLAITRDWARVKSALLKCDGYRCAVTGRPDINHPSLPLEEEDEMIKTAGCHILPRAIGISDINQRSQSYLSALTTLHILHHYASLPEKTIEDIAKIIDDPSNGMTLECNAHFGFDNFAWSLKEVKNIPNTYDVIYLRRGHGLLNTPERITFTDSSARCSETSPPPS